MNNHPTPEQAREMVRHAALGYRRDPRPTDHYGYRNHSIRMTTDDEIVHIDRGGHTGYYTRKLPSQHLSDHDP